MNYDRQYAEYKQSIDTYLANFVDEQKPRTLYEPARYILAAGGKRIRPLLVLLSCEAVGGGKEDAIHAGAALEILHNFTLVHDDIMDHAPSRRGRPTVHKKWDNNVAILAGDALLALAYRALLRTPSSRIREISKVFTEGVVEVCEGQAFDKEFEDDTNVGVADYLRMIQKKTGKMVAAATEIGGLIGNAQPEHLKALRRYGERTGRAFQVQDDLLDITADEEEFGKKIGSDLIEGKKTYLLLMALKNAKGRDRQKLARVFRNGGISKREVKEFRNIYEETGAIRSARQRIAEDIRGAQKDILRLPATEARGMLAWLTDMLLHRTY